MPLVLTNNPDIALAQEWIAQIHHWIAVNGLVGYDPFDVKAHPWIRAAQRRPLLRKATTAICDLFPHASRYLLDVAPTLNPKALALTALGDMRLYQVTGDKAHLTRGLDRLDELRRCACDNHAGLCWGYPFAVHAVGLDTPRDTPVAVVCAIAGEAFLLAHEITREQKYLDAADDVARFMLDELPRLESPGGDWCFAYTPTDRRRVHNANLLVVEHIARTAERLNNDALGDEIGPALNFTLSRQRDDGAWPNGEHIEGDPYEPGLMRLVDHHHTGFVLRSLFRIQKVLSNDGIADALRRGIVRYTKLIRPNGMPVNEYAAWPVDIHACAEGILCPSALVDVMPGALARALLVMRWTHQYLRDTRSGMPWYRKYPGVAAHIIFPRWGVAWMYRALAEYLYAHTVSRDRNKADGPRADAQAHS